MYKNNLIYFMNAQQSVSKHREMYGILKQVIERMEYKRGLN